MAEVQRLEVIMAMSNARGKPMQKSDCSGRTNIGRRFLIVATLAFALVGGAFADAAACSRLAVRPPLGEINRAQTIFLGRLISLGKFDGEISTGEFVTIRTYMGEHREFWSVAFPWDAPTNWDQAHGNGEVILGVETANVSLATGCGTIFSYYPANEAKNKTFTAYSFAVGLQAPYQSSFPYFSILWGRGIVPESDIPQFEKVRDNHKSLGKP
jgi:hypothetical protein